MRPLSCPVYGTCQRTYAKASSFTVRLSLGPLPLHTNVYTHPSHPPTPLRPSQARLASQAGLCLDLSCSDRPADWSGRPSTEARRKVPPSNRDGDDGANPVRPTKCRHPPPPAASWNRQPRVNSDWAPSALSGTTRRPEIVSGTHQRDLYKHARHSNWRMPVEVSRAPPVTLPCYMYLIIPQ